MPNRSIYITDLDHTFLHTDQTISDFSTEVWNTKNKDAILSVATARSFQKTRDFLEKLHLHAPMILLDGTMIVSPDKKLIDLKTINKALGDAIVEVGLQFDIDPFIIGLKDMDLNEAFLYPRKLNEHQKFVLKGYKNDPRLQFNPDNKTMDMNLKIVYFGDKKTLEPLTAKLKTTFKDAIECKLSPEKYSDGYFLTILHPEGDKAHALQKVMDYLERDPEDVTVFGDSVNDIGMFKLAGTSVAVSNALDEVKAVADIILPHSNDEDAVAKYLKSNG
ncbi:HAD family hydrolase [Sulfurovum sp. XGS-02]|uniref:HAD hydrolase family protein n=1 Tax=Sulfurovum sp. XGS-02 TaxID=2925411 RepID=UPI00205514B9|nr:HAD hydrolase family protein [Sulfurovum sp. XGS-02]UPT78439.1 HAD family hydrolase [Sulfurovum sp. XGS-02]